MITLNIQKRWFNYIKYGSKRIELRLNDKKRQAIRIGDVVELKTEGDSLKVRVVGKYLSRDFRTLFKDFPDMGLFGDKSISEEEMLKIMGQFYPIERQHENGVVGLRLEAVNGLD